MVNKKNKITLLVIISIFTVGLIWGYHKYKYPYGKTHRCSKSLAMLILDYADANDGEFPTSTLQDALGLAVLVETDPHALSLIVGKAGNLKEAKKFYYENGYIKKEHSSWHYVQGLSSGVGEVPIIWDKIPLGHNGQRNKENTREVIMSNGQIFHIPEDEWDAFFEKLP